MWQKETQRCSDEAIQRLKAIQSGCVKRMSKMTIADSPMSVLK